LQLHEIGTKQRSRARKGKKSNIFEKKKIKNGKMKCEKNGEKNGTISTTDSIE